MDLRVGQLSKIRVVPRPGKGLRSLVDRAPQAEAFADGLNERLRPAFTWLYQARRRLSTAAVAIFTAWLFIHVMFGANGMVIYRQKRAEYQNLQKEMEGLQKENNYYTQQDQALKTDPKTIEREAREQLHYARPGEVVYVAPPPAPIPNPGANAAKK